jgi:spore coat polysaccharide biosynthesis protein SpsF
MNLKALQLLYPGIVLNGVEINSEAARELAEQIGEERVFCGSIMDYQPSERSDLCLIKGVLIHVNPEMLTIVYDKLFSSCKRYLLVAEYYNPVPMSIPYRGHTDRLFKRDFAGEIMERHSSLRLIDYGFSYRRDPSFPQDDINWFLMEKM